MFKDIDAYFVETILPTFKRFKKIKENQTIGMKEDLNLAFDLSSKLYHLREHLPTGFEMTYNDILKKCPEYEILGNVVNASKHGKLTKGNAKIKSSQDIYEVIVTTIYQDSKGEFNHTQKEIMVQLINGTAVKLFGIIVSVLNMWLTELHSVGLIRSYKLIKTNSRLPRRSKKFGVLNIKTIHGLPFEQVFQLQKYNYVLKKIEPVNLTGSQILMTIRPECIYTCDLVIDKGSKGKIEVEIPISTEQFNYLNSLQDDTKRASSLIDIGLKKKLISKKLLKSMEIIK